MSFPDLSRFQLTPGEAADVRREFALAASSVKLHDVAPGIRRSVPAVSGCYFWTMRGGNAEYKIYIGRTRSLRTRLKDYTNAIQIHAPNDYKLRFFQEFIHQMDSAAEFDLYVMQVPESDFKAKETELVRRFQPFVNFLRPPTAEDRARIQHGFRQYYEDAFRHRLDDA
jgi:hypothetical protein